jgi:hypothetical protein
MYKVLNVYLGRFKADDVQYVIQYFNDKGLSIDVVNPIIDDKRTNPNYIISYWNITLGQLEYNVVTKEWEAITFNNTAFTILNELIGTRFTIWKWF